tara:strand:+ start:96 stop:563 length:468 start_codon:yes stop_codon:yes gene_type:complete
MSSPTSSETSSSLHSQVQSHLQQILTEENIPDLDAQRFPKRKISSNYRTCGALNKITDPPRPSGNNPAFYCERSVDQGRSLKEMRWSSKFPDSSNYGSSPSQSPNHSSPQIKSSSPTLKNCFLGRINSVLDGESREFARVKDPSGERTNLIYLFP